MSDVADELNRAGSADTGLGFTLDLLLRTLPPPLGELFMLVSIPHEFDADIMQALDPSLTQLAAQDACEKLARLSVIRRMSAAFALHDSARQHLFPKWLTTERLEAFRSVSQRLAAFFQRSLTNDTVRNRWIFHLIGANPNDGFREFETACDRERRQSRLSECRTLINLVHEYDGMLTDEQRAALAYQEGRLAVELADWETAAAYLSLARNSPGSATLLRVKTDRWLGIVDRERRQFADSIHRLTAAVALAKRTPECREEIDDLLRELAVTHREAGDFAKAELLLKESIALAEETRDVQSLAAGWNSLGALYSHRRQHRSAVAAFTNAVSFLSDGADRARMAQLKNNLGMAYVDAGDLSRGEAFLHESLEIKRAIGDTRGQAVTLGNLADLYAVKGEVSEALQTCNNSIQAFQSVRDHYAAAIVARNLGRAFRRSRDFDAARNSLSQAVELFCVSRQEDAAAKTQREIDRLGVKVRLPWWAWLIIAIPFAGGLILMWAISGAQRGDPVAQILPASVAPPQEAVRELSVNGLPVTGTLEPTRSAWFLFTAAAGAYVIEADSEFGDTVLLLYAKDTFDVIAQDDDGGEATLSSKLSVTLAPGAYYIEVRDYQGRSVAFTVRAFPAIKSLSSVKSLSQLACEYQTRRRLSSLPRY